MDEDDSGNKSYYLYADILFRLMSAMDFLSYPSIIAIYDAGYIWGYGVNYGDNSVGGVQ